MRAHSSRASPRSRCELHKCLSHVFPQASKKLKDVCSEKLSYDSRRSSFSSVWASDVALNAPLFSVRKFCWKIFWWNVLLDIQGKNSYIPCWDFGYIKASAVFIPSLQTHVHSACVFPFWETHSFSFFGKNKSTLFCASLLLLLSLPPLHSLLCLWRSVQIAQGNRWKKSLYWH